MKKEGLEMQKKKIMYHLSDVKGLNKLTRFIPNNTMTRKFGENSTTPRICCSETVDGCIRALGGLLENKTMHLYALRDVMVTEPSISDVPDVENTGEFWVLDDWECEYIETLIFDENANVVHVERIV